MDHEHNWEISALTPIGYDPTTPLPMDAPTVTYCTICGSTYAPGVDNDQKTWHLVIEDDNGNPYISGCDCAYGKDHYEAQTIT